MDYLEKTSLHSTDNNVTQRKMLLLPKAHKIIPEILARWNFSKGRADEMTCILDSMNFTFTKGMPKQQFVM